MLTSAFAAITTWKTSYIIAIVAMIILVAAATQNPPKFTNDNNDEVYFAIAAPTASSPGYGRIFNRTLANITLQIEGGVWTRQRRRQHRISTLTIPLPDSGIFSGNLLSTICEQFQGRQIIAVLILGDSAAANTVALIARHIGIPVLWAKGRTGVMPALRTLELSPLEVQLAPTSRELVQSLRAVLLQAHWHTFTMLVDPVAAAVLRRAPLWATLTAPPLHPILIPLPSPLRTQSLFRKLADISRSTRGVVVLLCDRPIAVRVLEEAKRLNMMDGHFVWLWVDTAPNTTRTANTTTLTTSSTHLDQSESMMVTSVVTEASSSVDQKERIKHSLSKILQQQQHDQSVDYLLRNDHFLLFHNHQFERYKSTDSGSVNHNKLLPSRAMQKNKNSADALLLDLPAGLISLKALPIRVDRFLVKGALRLLHAALTTTLTTQFESFEASDRELYYWNCSCWKDSHRPHEDHRFSAVFVRELRAACAQSLAGKKPSLTVHLHQVETNNQEISVDRMDKSLVANFEILNLVPERGNSPDRRTNRMANENAREPVAPSKLRWKRVGMVSGQSVRLDTIIWPGGDLSVAAVSRRAKTVFRVVTALAPPFVMESDLDEDGQCLRGLSCHRVLTSDKDNLTLVFNEMQRLEEDSSVESTDADGESKKNIFQSQNLKNSSDRLSSDQTTDAFHSKLPYYQTKCCYGLSMDLLEHIAEELEFDFHLYIVADGHFGSKVPIRVQRRTRRKSERTKILDYRRKEVNIDGIVPEDDLEVDVEDAFNVKWNGIMGDLVSGAAHMSFAALSMSSSRSEVVDFSAPYFYSGVSFLAAPQQRSEIPLMAFLLPFSTELWIAIFTSLNITAIAVAIYEWLSPFGLNPWGRQRSKNFSMSSALWVMWGLLCGHLVAFKAPKSWPNKFLINVWGGFSVIFVASYTANIAALIAGLFFQNTVSNYHDRSLLSQKVGAPKYSAAEYYVQKANTLLAHHMRKYALNNVVDGIERLRNRTLDILIADTPILDYYMATDHGCKLQKIGDTINQDTYAIGMAKGFPLKDSISAVIAKYSSNGYMDILQEKWYGSLPCFKLATEIAQPRPLGVAAVTGVFILLGVGMIMGVLILIVEHLFFKYMLPILRQKAKDSVWRSRNIMFFSQKLYRFINCVELVSPHHAARELVHTIRQGQITSLFQKSIKRKEHEQRRRRRSKAQFFEMIQEIRRQQHFEREQSLAPVTETAEAVENTPNLGTEKSSVAADSSDTKRGGGKLSPRRNFLLRSSASPKRRDSSNRVPSFGGVSVGARQLFNSPLMGAGRRHRRHSAADDSAGCVAARLPISNAFAEDVIGRRLSRDAGSFLVASPPDINSRRASGISQNAENICKKNGYDLSDGDVAKCGQIAEELQQRFPQHHHQIHIQVDDTDSDFKGAPLKKLSKEELLELNRFSDVELREILLKMLREKQEQPG